MREEPTGEPGRLLEHFFRHESARLVSVLTRAFGFHRLDLVEDKVQEAMMTALASWRHRGVPDNPAGWIHRVARNRILDALRREEVHERAVSHVGSSEESAAELVDEWLSDEQLPDSLLRMMFVCCHPALDRRSQLALTLKLLGGFSVAEVASGLLLSEEAAKKRIQRAKTALGKLAIRLELPPPDEQRERLAAVQEVLYLLFNEGYSSSRGAVPISDDICEEATRLCHLLARHDELSTPSTRALLALMLFHAARLDARLDGEGAAVLLEDQDRERWDRRLITVARAWLERSRTDAPGRFHFEATIAMLHCEADSVATTRWGEIVGLYDRLLALGESPVFALNRAIARAELGEHARALAELNALKEQREMREYPLLDCAIARVHERMDDRPAAVAAYRRALASARAAHEVSILERKLAALESRPS